jgi:DnaJ-class molecular chaperone
MRAFMAVMVVVAVGCDIPVSVSQDVDAAITAELACEASLAIVASRNQPSPDKPVSGQCDNCNGTGKIGDGKIVMVCPSCNGTGKKTTRPAK